MARRKAAGAAVAILLLDLHSVVDWWSCVFTSPAVHAVVAEAPERVPAV